MAVSGADHHAAARVAEHVDFAAVTSAVRDSRISVWRTCWEYSAAATPDPRLPCELARKYFTLLEGHSKITIIRISMPISSAMREQTNGMFSGEAQHPDRNHTVTLQAGKHVKPFKLLHALFSVWH
jgi:hypothetical protein